MMHYYKKVVSRAGYERRAKQFRTLLLWCFIQNTLCQLCRSCAYSKIRNLLANRIAELFAAERGQILGVKNGFPNFWLNPVRGFFGLQLGFTVAKVFFLLCIVDAKF